MPSAEIDARKRLSGSYAKPRVYAVDGSCLNTLFEAVSIILIPSSSPDAAKCNPDGEYARALGGNWKRVATI